MARTLSFSPLPPPLDGVTLRPWRLQDAGALAREAAAPDIRRWWGGDQALSEHDALTFIAATHERLELDRGLQLAIVDTANDAILGYVGVDGVHPLDRVGEVSYWTAIGARGRGIASAALRQLSPSAIRQLRLQRLMAYTAPSNLPSQRVAAKGGYRFGGLHPTRLGPSILYVFDDQKA